MIAAKLKSYALTLIALAILGVMLFPAYWMVNVSLQQNASAIGLGLFPTNPTFSAYWVAIRDQGAHLVTSLIIAFGTVVVTLAVAAPAAFALAKLRISWAGAFILVLLVTQMIPGIVIANALYVTYTQLGLINNLWGLILADASHAVPFAVLILRAYMTDMPGELIEAARVDGAGYGRTFLSIVLPVNRGGLITASLFTFLFGWSDFLFALTLTTSDDIRPITLGIYTYLDAQTQEWGPVMASSVLSALPAAVVLVLAQRYIAAGATAGAVK